MCEVIIVIVLFQATKATKRQVLTYRMKVSYSVAYLQVNE
jgi:hypothetical protein